MGPFETERLVIRRMEAADVPVLRELIYSDRDVWGEYSGLGDNPALLEEAFANHVSQSEDAEFGRQAVVLKASGETIGQVHLDPYVNRWYRVAGDPKTPVSNVEVELAFAFGKAYWGQGYAVEACRALIDYAFNELKIPRLVGGARLTNDRSVLLQQRLGFDVYVSDDPDAGGQPGWVSVLNNPLAA